MIGILTDFEVTISGVNVTHTTNDLHNSFFMGNGSPLGFRHVYFVSLTASVSFIDKESADVG